MTKDTALVFALCCLAFLLVAGFAIVVSLLRDLLEQVRYHRTGTMHARR